MRNTSSYRIIVALRSDALQFMNLACRAVLTLLQSLLHRLQLLTVDWYIAESRTGRRVVGSSAAVDT
jgi:hypothetical protein